MHLKFSNLARFAKASGFNMMVVLERDTLDDRRTLFNRIANIIQDNNGMISKAHVEDINEDELFIMMDISAPIKPLSEIIPESEDIVSPNREWRFINWISRELVSDLSDKYGLTIYSLNTIRYNYRDIGGSGTYDYKYNFLDGIYECSATLQVRLPEANPTFESMFDPEDPNNVLEVITSDDTVLYILQTKRTDLGVEDYISILKDVGATVLDGSYINQSSLFNVTTKFAICDNVTSINKIY